MDKQLVLIIEDDKDAAGFFDLVFNLLGFCCKKISNVEDALEALDHLQPDMILLDLRLGSATGGEEILFRVRGDERFDETRVVIVTAYPVLAQEISDLADLVLVKPVDVNQLKQLTGRLLGVEIRPKRFFYRDPMTELFNRDFFETRLEHAYERARRRADFQYAVILLQIRSLTKSLSSSGSLPLRQIYREAAARLRSSFRPTDTIAYLDNGLFAGLYEELKHTDDVMILMNRMHSVLGKPFIFGSTQNQPNMWIGAALSSMEFARPVDIIAEAERSMTELIPLPNLDRSIG